MKRLLFFICVILSVAVGVLPVFLCHTIIDLIGETRAVCLIALWCLVIGAVNHRIQSALEKILK